MFSDRTTAPRAESKEPRAAATPDGIHAHGARVCGDSGRGCGTRPSWAARTSSGLSCGRLWTAVVTELGSSTLDRSQRQPGHDVALHDEDHDGWREDREEEARRHVPELHAHHVLRT